MVCLFGVVGEVTIGVAYEHPLRINYSMAGCFPENLRGCLIEHFCQGSVKCFEQSSGLYTAIYKNVPLTL